MDGMVQWFHDSGGEDCWQSPLRTQQLPPSQPGLESPLGGESRRPAPSLDPASESRACRRRRRAMRPSAATDAQCPECPPPASGCLVGYCPLNTRPFKLAAAMQGGHPSQACSPPSRWSGELAPVAGDAAGPRRLRLVQRLPPSASGTWAGWSACACADDASPPPFLGVVIFPHKISSPPHLSLFPDLSKYCSDKNQTIFSKTPPKVHSQIQHLLGSLTHSTVNPWRGLSLSLALSSSLSLSLSLSPSQVESSIASVTRLPASACHSAAPGRRCLAPAQHACTAPRTARGREEREREEGVGGGAERWWGGSSSPRYW